MKKNLRKEIKDLMIQEFENAVKDIYYNVSTYDEDGWIITPTSDEKQLPLYMNDPDNPFNCLFAKWRLKGQSFYGIASLGEFEEILTKYYEDHDPDTRLLTTYEQGRMYTIAVTLRKLGYNKESILVKSWSQVEYGS